MYRVYRENGDLLELIDLGPGDDFSGDFSAKIAGRDVNSIYPGRRNIIKAFNKSW